MQHTIRIDGVDGPLDIRIDGEGDRTLVFVHGWPDTLELWDGTVRTLSPRFRCVRFTLPGFEGPGPHRAYALGDMVGTLSRAIDEVSPGRPVELVVHDWGAVYGYRYASQHPGRVSRIVGVDIGDAGSPGHLRSLSLRSKLGIVAYQWWLALAWRLGARLGDPMTRALVRRLPCPARPEQVGARMNHPYWVSWTGANGGYPRVPAFDPPCPMLFVYGARKPFLFHSPRWAEALGQRPGCRVAALPTGHWVMHEAGPAFDALVEDWLSGSPAAEATA
jgi:pimeloyl-ACP methyl ester carboxylesterase